MGCGSAALGKEGTHIMRAILSIYAIALGCLAMPASAEEQGAERIRFIIDQVQHNPGEAMTKTKYMDPLVLAEIGHNGQVLTDYRFIHCLITYEDFDPRIFPEGTEGRKWVDEHAAKMDQYIANAKKAGIKIYYQIDALVFPKKLVELYKDEICDENGRHIVFDRPKTIEIYRYMLDAVFKRFPGLDGLVVRTGETYRKDIPFHTGNGPVRGKWGDRKATHIKLIELLREELCVKRNKQVIYRTWDWGKAGIHDYLNNYLEVSDAIEPHSLLAFSTKHQRGDFHRMSVFNPTIGPGKHPRIVEVQCQLEAYGKAAHPYYNGQGVIDGWEEYAQTMGDKKPKGLKDLLKNPLFVGVWTWSRGGGWGGPFIKNEFWTDLNTYVVANWARNPTRTEEDVFNEFAYKKAGIKDADNLARFRKIALLSAAGVLRGQNSMIHPLNPWWSRDDKMNLGGLSKYFAKIIKQGEVEAVLKEKDESVEMWQEIEKLSRELKLDDRELADYIRVSSTYGRIKYDLVRQGFITLLLGMTGDQTGKYDKVRIAQAIKKYDQLWDEWEQLQKAHPSCATIYQKPGSSRNKRTTGKVTFSQYREVIK